MNQSANGDAKYWPRAMTPGSTSRMLIMILLAALAGSAIGGTVAYYFEPESLDIFRKSGAVGGAMLSVATGVYRW